MAEIRISKVSDSNGYSSNTQDRDGQKFNIPIGKISEEDYLVVEGALRRSLSSNEYYASGDRDGYLRSTVAGALGSLEFSRREQTGNYSVIDPDTKAISTFGSKYEATGTKEEREIAAASLGVDKVPELPVITELKSVTVPSDQQSYKKEIIDGPIVNPYKNINLNKNIVIEQYESIGGADLSLYMLMEVPLVEDIDLPEEVQRKETLTIEMDNAMSLSYSTVREKFPVRRLDGSSNAISYVKGPRTISGHIAFAVMTKDILQHIRSRVVQEINKIEANFSEYTPESTSGQKDSIERYQRWLEEKYYYSKTFLNNKIQLLDDLPPFHILCMGANEYGIFSKFIIKNVHIIDENQYQGTQQPNIINKVTWVAEDIIPMNEVNKWNENTVLVSSINSIESSYSNGRFNGQINYNKEISGSTLLDDISNSIDKESMLYGNR